MAHTRRCTACHRPCKGHRGPTGKRCPIAYERDYPPLEVTARALGDNRFTLLHDDVSNPESPVDSVPPSFDSPPRDTGNEVRMEESRVPMNEQNPGPLNLSTTTVQQAPPGAQVNHVTGTIAGSLPPSAMSTPGEGGPQYVTMPSGHVVGPTFATGPNLVRMFEPVPYMAPFNSGAGAQVVQTINRPVASAVNYNNWPSHPQPLAGPRPEYVATGGSNPAVPSWPSYGGHALPAHLWQTQSGHNNPAQPAQYVVAPSTQIGPSAPARPDHVPGSPGGAASAWANTSSYGPTGYSSAQPATQVVPPTLQSWAPIANSYATAPQAVPYPTPSQVVYRHTPPQGVSAPQLVVSGPLLPDSAARPSYSGPSSTNAIHPSASASGVRPQTDLGLEFLEQKTIDAALRGECANLEEFMSCHINDAEELKSQIDNMGNVQIKSVKSKKHVNSILKWLECWVNYEMLMCRHYGHNVYLEMAKYRRFVIEISQKYKFSHVATYDIRHRRRLAHSGSLLYSQVDHDLYVTIFDSGAVRSSGKCAKCASLDHVTSDCSVKSAAAGRGSTTRRGPGRGRRWGGAGRSEICYNFQSGNCSWGGDCIRRHKCVGCGGDNPQSTCGNPSCKAAVSGASRTAVQAST